MKCTGYRCFEKVSHISHWAISGAIGSAILKMAKLFGGVTEHRIEALIPC